MTNPAEGDARQALELARTAQARFETIEAAAQRGGLDLDRIAACSESILGGIHSGPQQANVMWVLEIATAMLMAVMAVNREPVPISSQVDPASYAMSVLRDLQTAAGEKDLSWDSLELAAAAALKRADEDAHTHAETFWALSRAAASCELGWARSLAASDDSTAES